MGDTQGKPGPGNHPHRRLVATSIATAMVAGYLGVGGYAYFRKYIQSEPTASIQASHTRLFVDKIRSCSTLELLRLELPELSRHLKVIARSGGADSLAEVYRRIHQPMLDLMNDTRLTHGKWAYGDDLTILGDLFRNAGSKREQLAIIFLSLPRLCERGANAAFSPDREMFAELPGRTWDAAKISAERDFLSMLENEGYGETAGLLKKYWYTDDHQPPVQKAETAFFEAFIKLY